MHADAPRFFKARIVRNLDWVDFLDGVDFFCQIQR